MVLCLFKKKIAATCTDCKPILNSLPLRNSFLFPFYFRSLPRFIPDASSILLHLLGKKNNAVIFRGKKKIEKTRKDLLLDVSSIAHIPCITQVTFKFINDTLLVNNRGLNFVLLKLLIELRANEHWLDSHA